MTKSRQKHGLMTTACAFLCTKNRKWNAYLAATSSGLMRLILRITLFGKIQKEEKLNSIKKRKSGLLVEIACYLFIHVFVERIQL